MASPTNSRVLALALMEATRASSCSTATCCEAKPPPRDVAWLEATRTVRRLSWLSLAWMTLEGIVGLAAGYRAGSIALVAWALSSAVEGLASVIVIWRFTGSRTLSETSEKRAQKAVAVSFWLLAPYVAVESVRNLVEHDVARVSVLGMALTLGSLIAMPLLARAKKRLGAKLASSATASEGSQNMLCAYLAAAVLAGLGANAWLGWWWLDPLIGLAIAVQAVREGREAWRGEACC